MHFARSDLSEERRERKRACVTRGRKRSGRNKELIHMWIFEK